MIPEHALNEVVRICTHSVAGNPFGTLCVCAYARQMVRDRITVQQSTTPSYIPPNVPVIATPPKASDVTTQSQTLVRINIPQSSSFIEDVDDALWGLI